MRSVSSSITVMAMVIVIPVSMASLGKPDKQGSSDKPDSRAEVKH